MSLFPAYADENSPKENLTWSIESGKSDEWDMAIAGPMSPSAEGRLLQSDSEDEMAGRVPSPTRPPTPEPDPDFYVDRKMDRGNLRVSTLYYPGRPEYRSRAAHAALGAARARRGAAPARYFLAPAPPPDDAADVAARSSALQRHLAEDPRDLRTWLHYIDLQEAHGGAGAALAAAAAAAARGPRCAALLRARCRLAPAALPAHAAADALATLRAEESSAFGRQLVDRQLALLAARGGGGAELRRLLQLKPSADLLAVYGWYLSTAGHWERLTQLIELVATLLFPRSPVFPVAGLALSKEDEEKLEDYEDKVIHSGLPLTALWARVERARSAAHWRPLAGGAGDAGAADEERSPRESETASLLPTLPPPPHILLTLAQIPMFGLYSVEDDLPPSPLQQLLPMLDAAWVDPDGADSRVGSALWSGAALQELLRTYVDPPTYLASDDYGFWQWTCDLFLATISLSAGRRRLAAAAHAQRWLRAVLAAGGGAAARGAARRLLRAEPAPLAAAEYSRVEARAAAVRREPLKLATRAARAAARAALEAARATPAPGLTAQALYCARAAASVLAQAGGGAEGRGLLLRAALARGADGALTAQDEQEALRLIREKSEEIERELLLECPDAFDAMPSAAPQYEDLLLPGEAEWGVAKMLLLPPTTAELLHLHERLSLGGPRAYAYGATCARAAISSTAAVLATFYPHDPYLQLAAARTPAWRQWGSAGVPGAGSVTRPSATRQLARALPHLLRGASDAQALQRAHRELSRGPSTELRARLSLATQAAPAETAVDAAPTSKWVYVAAGAGGGDVWSLQALMLERQLRLRTLHQELRAVRPVTHAPA